MGQALWTADELAAATGGTLVAGKNWQVQGICIDSRNANTDDLFVALEVERDGHDFVQSALDAGAAASLVANGNVPGAKLVVKNTQSALEQVAIAARKRSNASRIAVTGSVGKTSVKDALAIIFSQDGATHKSVKSYNNQWGVPLSLARMPVSSKYGVFEIGTSSPGEIAPLCGLVRPDIGIITRIAEAHLAGFGSVTEIALEKASLLAGMGEGGTAILPADDACFDLLQQQAGYFSVQNIMTFGRADGCTVQILNWNTGLDGSDGLFLVNGKQLQIKAPVTGMHWAEILAASMCAALAAELAPDVIASAMQLIKPPSGRGGLVTLPLVNGSAVLMDDSYNANPTSMTAALDTLSRMPAKRKLAVLGQMLELGAEERRLHAELSWPIEQAKLAKVWCVGELMRALHQKLPAQRQAAMSDDVDGLAADIYAELQDGDVVLVKGSNGSGVHKIATQLQQIAKAQKSGK
ncbi:UDP-N-acetylmuramoyl-tripeptide--D-alanyl-D-alanine ligase [hydrothermal vent metagenome]|uniref:UDP-MurNAc-pentapeptide synthetase n=1 Tax=hydrothermal vent metagenome TaxID=652676 RepID=A0A3B0SAD4_9ZZZZ